MHTHICKVIAAACLVSLATPTLSGGSGEKHWGYSGKEGPEHWAELSEENKACAGGQQSPIDLVATHGADNESVELNWESEPAEILNNGHTIQANVPKGSVTLFGGKRYALLQFHFHHMSEHTIKGRHSPLEAHFVHSGEDGSLLVLGVMFEPGKENAELEKVWAVAPSKPGSATTNGAVTPASLIPGGQKFYRYEGSLTTPPCSEIVHWVVYTKPLAASQAQIDAFAMLYPRNNRPVQALNRRFVLVGD